MTARFTKPNAARWKQELLNGGGKRGIRVQNNLYLGDIFVRDSRQRCRYSAKPIAPILPPVTCNKKFGRTGLVDRPSRIAKSNDPIDPAVSGHMDLARHPFAPQIGRAKLGRREQKVRIPIYRDSELLLGPRTPQVMASKACLDMGDRNSAEAGGERAAERTSGIALDDNEARTLDAQYARQQLTDRPDIMMWVVLGGTMQAERRIRIQAVLTGIKC